MTEENTGNGLGLETFLNPSSGEVSTESSSTEESISPSEKTEVSETKEEVSTEVIADSSTSEGEVEAKTDEESSFNWETEDNPFVNQFNDTKKQLETMEKRFQDTQTNYVNQNRDYLNVQNQLKIMEQKIDGTYDETAQPDTTQADEFQRDYNIKFETSKTMAVKEFGEDFLNEKLFSPTAPFQQLNGDVVNVTRVQASPTPVHEALRIVEENEFYGKYGNDFKEIVSNIKKEIEPSIREEVTKELGEKITQKNAQPTTLTNVNSSNETSKDKGEPKTPPLKALFG